MNRNNSPHRHVAMIIAFIVMLAAPVFAGASQQATPDHGTSTAVRVLSIDGDTGDLTLLNGQNGDPIAFYTAPGPTGFVVGTGSESSEWMLVNYYDGNKTVIMDTGMALHAHGDHFDLELGQSSIRTTVDANAPAHFWLHDGLIASVNDADNTINLWNEADLATNAAPFVIPLAIDEPDHGSIVIANDTIYMAYYGNGRVQTYSLEGELLNDHLSDCAGAHGEAVVGDLVLFACAGDVLVLNQDGEQVRISYPESQDDALRSNLLAATDNPNIVVGDSAEGLLEFDIESESSSLIALEQPIRAATVSGSTVVALDATGTLHGIDPVTGEAVWATRVAMGHAEFLAEESNAFYPFMGAAAGNIYVADPGSGSIVVVDADTGEITNSFDVGGRPSKVIVVAASGVEH